MDVADRSCRRSAGPDGRKTVGIVVAFIGVRSYQPALIRGLGPSAYPFRGPIARKGGDERDLGRQLPNRSMIVRRDDFHRVPCQVQSL